MKRENEDEQEEGSTKHTEKVVALKNVEEEPKSKNYVTLSDTIRMFPDEKLSDHANILGAIKFYGCFASQLIVVKLVDNAEHNKKEPRILSKLNHHGNVISLIDTGIFDNGLESYIFIAMDKCHEEHLGRYLENRKEIPFDQKLEILRQIMTGIEYIHGKKIAHLDLKPGNILFTLDQSLIKIADFGLSEEIPKKKLFVKYQFGTNGFRPPESFGNSFVSLKTDIFSLGVLFHFVLSNGKNPFGEDPDGQNVNMKNGEMDLSCLLVPNFETTKHLIKSMLELERNNRPTISEVSEHPCWTGDEEECNFDYRREESSDSDSCHEEEEEPAEYTYRYPNELATLLALQKRYALEHVIGVIDEKSKKIQTLKPSNRSWVFLQNVPDEICEKGYYAVAVDQVIFVLAMDKTGFKFDLSKPGNGWIDLPVRSKDGRVRVVECGGQVYAFHNNIWKSEVIEILEPDHTSWRKIRKPKPCCDEAITATKGCIFTFGGLDGRARLQRSMKFDPTHSSWMNLPDMPTARDAAAATALDDKIYVMGGHDGEDILKTTECFDVTTQKWTTLKPMNNPHSYFNTFAFDGKVYAVGSGHLDPFVIEEYDPTTDTWKDIITVTDKEIIYPKETFVLQR